MQPSINDTMTLTDINNNMTSEGRVAVLNETRHSYATHPTIIGSKSVPRMPNLALGIKGNIIHENMGNLALQKLEQTQNVANY